MSSLLEVEDLVVRYPVPRGIVGTVKRAPSQSVHAVDGISFDLAAGEMVALVGESGCGKTSTAQAVMRLVDAEAGAIRFEGRDLTGSASARRSKSRSRSIASAGRERSGKNACARRSSASS
jgi:ABC-type glutathione transport system ATPase component